MWDKQLINWCSISCINWASHRSDGRCQNLLRTHSMLWLGGFNKSSSSQNPSWKFVCMNFFGLNQWPCIKNSWSEGCLGPFLGTFLTSPANILKIIFTAKPVSQPNLANCWPYNPTTIEGKNPKLPGWKIVSPPPKKKKNCNQWDEQLLNWCSISYISPFHVRIGCQ